MLIVVVAVYSTFTSTYL